MHNIVSSVLVRYLGHYFTAQYCRQRTMQIYWSLLCCTILQAANYIDILAITLMHNTVGSVLCRYLGHYFDAIYCRKRTMYKSWQQRTTSISWSLLCCTILQAGYYLDMLVVTFLHITVGSVLCRYLGRYFAAQYCRQRLWISWSLLCCTILQAAYYVDILVITLLHNTVGSVLCRYLGHYFAAQYCRQCTMQISWSLLCCTILQAAYYVDILVITLLHNIVGSVLCRYLGHYFAAQYCRQRTMQISWSLLCCTILQAAYYVDILVITFCCRKRTMYILQQRTMQISWSLLCCTILQAAYYVDILVITLLHNIVGSVLCRYLGHYFAAQYCRQRTMQISWSLLCCTILQAAMQISWSLLCCTILYAAYYVDILVITLLHNIVGSVLCRYLGHYFAAQYCRQRTMQISWSLLCCTILQAAYYVDILVITLLHNTVGSVLCRYLGHYFAAQYCRQRTMQISWSLLCCTILQAAYYVDILVVTLLHNIVAAYYVDILVVTLLHNIVDSVLCRYLGHYFAAQYCRQRTMQISWSLLCCTILQAAYYVDILVITLLHNIVDSVLCRYLGHYFAAQYCRQRTMQISWSLLCCTILQAAYYVDILVITLLHNIVGSVLCRYLGHYFAAQYCRAAYYVDILVITLLHNIVGSVLCRYLGHYFAAQYCRQRTMQISWSLLCCTILQEAYYVDILVITLLHNIVGSVLCRYLGHYFAAQYCRQRTMQISWSLLCCTIMQAAYYVDILVITLLHNTVGSVLCRYLGHYFAAQYCRQRTMQISWSLLCCTILQAAYYVDILVITLLHNIVGSVLCRYLGHYFAAQYCRQRTMQISWSLLCCTILQEAYYVDILVITLLHNIVGSVLCRYLGRYFAAQYCRQRTMQISWSLLCCTILQTAYYVDILVITLLHNIVGSVLCRYLGHYFAAQYCSQRTMQISWSLLCCTILQAAYYVDILVITLLHNTVGSILCRYLGHYFAAQYCRQRTMQISWSLLCCTILQQRTMQISWSLLCCTIMQAAYYVDILVITLLHNIVGSVLCR